MIEEFQRIIDNLYYQIYCLSNSIKAYNTLSAQLAEVCTRLRKESGKLETFANKVGTYYTVDEKAINKRILDNKESVDLVISYIEGITSGINGKISGINSQIENNRGTIWYYDKKIREEKGGQ